MRVIFTVVLKSPFSSGLYPPLLYACHFYCGVEESIFKWTVSATFVCVFIFTVVLKSPFPSGLYPPLLYACHFYCGVEESIFKWTVSATFVCVSFLLWC